MPELLSSNTIIEHRASICLSRVKDLAGQTDQHHSMSQESAFSERSAKTAIEGTLQQMAIMLRPENYDELFSPW
jgi:hypothetical protein